MHNIIHGKCPDYFNHYIRYVKNRHNYTTRASTNLDLSTPFYSTMASKRSLFASGTRLWNNQDSTTRGYTSLCKFRNQLYKKYIDRNSRVNNFTISRNFELIFNCIFLRIFAIYVLFNLNYLFQLFAWTTVRTTGSTSNCVIQ